MTNHSSNISTPTEERSAHGKTFLSPLFVFAYRFRLFRPFVLKALDIFEGGEMYSYSLRKILKSSYQVEVGPYSYGPCLKPGVLPPGTIIGNYCSFAAGINFFRRNHPKDRLSTHPFFYNQSLGYLKHDTIHSISENPLLIGHDVWIGFNAIVLPGCRKIGDGAIIGAGAVVTKDVPDFGILVGNPGKIIGSRFSPEKAETWKRSQWWLKPIEELVSHMALFNRSIDESIVTALERWAQDSIRDGND